MSSYQSGCMKFFPYLRQRHNDWGGSSIRVFGCGGGTITMDENHQLQTQSTVDKIFSPQERRLLGLEGMIQRVVNGCSFDLTTLQQPQPLPQIDMYRHASLARTITLADSGSSKRKPRHCKRFCHNYSCYSPCPRSWRDWDGWVGKIKHIDEIVLRFLDNFLTISLSVV